MYESSIQPYQLQRGALIVIPQLRLDVTVSPASRNTSADVNAKRRKRLSRRNLINAALRLVAKSLV